MRSRTSRGVPEWSGGKDLYMGSHVLVTGQVSGSPVLYRDHRKGPGGPPGGATCPGGLRGLKVEGNQPLVGWGAPLGPPPAPRVGNPRGGGRPTWLGEQATPLGAHHEGPAGPLLPSSPAVLGEALQDCHAPPPPPRHCAVGSPSTSPFPLLDQEGEDAFPIVRVLNAEVPSVRR